MEFFFPTDAQGGDDGDSEIEAGVTFGRCNIWIRLKISEAY
jgi:hypothetical protein